MKKPDFKIEEISPFNYEAKPEEKNTVRGKGTEDMLKEGLQEGRLKEKTLEDKAKEQELMEIVEQLKANNILPEIKSEGFLGEEPAYKIKITDGWVGPLATTALIENLKKIYNLKEQE